MHEVHKSASDRAAEGVTISLSLLSGHIEKGDFKDEENPKVQKSLTSLISDNCSESSSICQLQVEIESGELLQIIFMQLGFVMNYPAPAPSQMENQEQQWHNVNASVSPAHEPELHSWIAAGCDHTAHGWKITSEIRLAGH